MQKQNTHEISSTPELAPPKLSLFDVLGKAGSMTFDIGVIDQDTDRQQSALFIELVSDGPMTPAQAHYLESRVLKRAGGGEPFASVDIEEGVLRLVVPGVQNHEQLRELVMAYDERRADRDSAPNPRVLDAWSNFNQKVQDMGTGLPSLDQLAIRAAEVVHSRSTR